MKNTSATPISRGRDNLFVYRKGKPFDTSESNEFVRKCLSPETEALSERAARMEMNKDKTPWYADVISIVLVISIIPIALLLERLFPEFWEVWGEIVFDVLLFTFVFIGPIIGARFRPSAKERVILLSESTKAVRAELGIPEAVREIDVLPYLYKETPKGAVPALRDGFFKNVPVCIWREGDDLCLSDEDALIKIPVKAIGEMREVARKVHVDAWYKAYAFDSPNYKPYVKQGFWMGIDVLSYLEIEIMTDSGIRYLLIPNYEARTFREPADPTRSL